MKIMYTGIVMSKNRDLAAAFGVLCAVLFSIAYMTGYFTEYIPVKYHFPIWVLNVLIIIFIALVRGVARWTALGAGIVGIVVVIWILFELTIIRPAEAFGPILGLIFAALFAFFAFRAYLEKPSN
jgi:nicotinamide riboside transporter PnuC